MISVIVPVYNLEEYLRSCLDSVLCCAYGDLEILCVDDGSTDGSWGILEDYARRDSRILPVRQENRGVSAARNRGLDMARGEWTVFLDGDDVLHPAFFSALEPYLPGHDLVICDAFRFRFGDAWAWPREEQICVREMDGVKSMGDHGVKCFVWGRLYRREILEGLRFREDMTLGEDRAFHLDLVSRYPELRILRTTKKLYGYCQREGSAVAETTADGWLKLAGDILQGCRKEVRVPGKALYLTESVKLAFSVRNLCREDPERLARAEALVQGCLREMKKTAGLSAVRRLGYWLMGKIPGIYQGLLWVQEKRARE